MTTSILWRSIAMLYPEFVQWVSQTQGITSETVTEEEYEKYRTAYARSIGAPDD